MKKKLFYVFLFVLFFSAVATAQERTITGTVRDANGLEMLGVAVVVKGENHGTQTDMEGRYSIKAAPGKTLEFCWLYLSRGSSVLVCAKLEVKPNFTLSASFVLRFKRAV